MVAGVAVLALSTSLYLPKQMLSAERQLCLWLCVQFRRLDFSTVDFEWFCVTRPTLLQHHFIRLLPTLLPPLLCYDCVADVMHTNS